MRSHNFSAGRLSGIVYWFSNGEGLPYHAHTDNDAHITIVAGGKIRVTIREKTVVESVEYEPGRCVHFQPGCDHEIIAVTDDTVIYNILTGG